MGLRQERYRAHCRQTVFYKFNIHRTTQYFLNGGVETFGEMAKLGIFIIDRVVQEGTGGGVDLKNLVCYVPDIGLHIYPAKDD